jgi:hypothetical protein
MKLICSSNAQRTTYLALDGVVPHIDRFLYYFDAYPGTHQQTGGVRGAIKTQISTDAAVQEELNGCTTDMPIANNTKTIVLVSLEWWWWW